MPLNYDLHVMGDIGRWYVSKGAVSYVASMCKDREMKVLICSMGGSTIEAMGISAIFREHGNVTAHFIGASASAATIISMGARHVTMDKDAVYLVHKCSCLIDTFDYFNADELEKQIEQLKKEKKDMEALDSAVAGMYASKCKKSKEDLLSLMSKDTWLTAREALEWGFVDEITSYEDDKGTSGKISRQSAEYLSKYGMPLPPGYSNKTSIIEKLKSWLKEEEDYDEERLCEPEPEFKHFRSLAKTEVAVKDGYCTISRQGLQNVEAALDSMLSKVQQLSQKEKALSDQNEALAQKGKEVESLTEELARSREEAQDLKSRIEEMTAKPAEEPGGSIVEAGSSKKDGKPFKTVKENTEFLINLVS